MNPTQTKLAIAAVPDMKIFYACFIALVTTAFSFILRAVVLLICYFHSKGGYKAVVLQKHVPNFKIIKETT